MLSIGVMSIRHADYYIALAQEDYYEKGGEPPGKWYGEAAAAFGLAGTVESESFRALFRGFHPDTGEALTQRQSHSGRAAHRAGWDLTFSAPKSVSALWSQCGPDLRAKLEACHERAVRAALDYLQEEAATTRRGKGGKTIEKAQLVFACFEHGTSRAHDPQLHTHSLLLNVAVRPDGSTGSVSSRSVFQHRIAAGTLYQAELAAQLRKECGLETVKNGNTIEVVGVPKALCTEFSKRRADILAQVESKGIQSAKGAAAVTLETRTAKESRPRDELFTEWRETAKAHGWTQSEAEALFNAEPKPKPRDRVDLRELADTKGFIRERDIVQQVAKVTLETGLAAVEIRQIAKELVEKHTVPVGNGRHLAPLVDRAQDIERIDPGDLEARIRAVEQRGGRVVAILPDAESAQAFQAAYRVESMTATQYLDQVRREDLQIVSFIQEMMNSPTPRELVYRFGPDIGQAFRAAGEQLEQYLKRNLPHIDLGIQRAMQKWGPDITELYRFARSKLFREDLRDARRVVILPQPEKMPAKDVIAIVASADMASRSLGIVEKAQAWLERERQLSIEHGYHRASSIER